MEEILSELSGTAALITGATGGIGRAIADPKLPERLVVAVMRCLRAAIRHMVTVASGNIVNIASDFAVVAGKREAVYCASKGAVLQLTKAMALNHGPQGIRVNAV